MLVAVAAAVPNKGQFFEIVGSSDVFPPEGVRFV